MSAIDEIKQRTDIVEVIGQYVTLKKAGRNLTALCPFHSEKTPSFFVFPERQSWHCFGACGTGGDVFSFIMKKEGMDFGEALRVLAQRAGVTLPSRVEKDSGKEAREELYRANEAAALYYHNLLLNSPGAEKARGYVVKRGFNPTTVADFQLGFSLDSWEALKQYLKEKGQTEENMLTAGLLVKAEDGRTHDRFRGKLMFPIRDSRGRVTGFGSRVLDDSLPKYVNSPQTPVFDKSGTLYGLDRAAAGIRKQDRAIIMEGYMDVITAHQNGVANAVASMGTAITETQVNTLKKLTKNLVMALDADAAGEEAMLRTVGYENILNAEIRVVIMPEGKDPDDVIREDVKNWQGLVNIAVPIVDYTFDKTLARLDLTTARDKSAAVDRLLPTVAAITDPIRQAHYLQKLAGLIKVGIPTLEAALARMRPAAARRITPLPRREVITPARRPLFSSPREEYALTLLLRYPELKKLPEGPLPEFFESTENREIFNAWQAVKDVPALKERLDPSLREHLDAIINKSLPAGRNDIEPRYADCVMELRKKYLKGLAARKGESGETADLAQLEEDVKISTQLREIEARKSKRTGARR
ncbi:MAG TPA: DNA primase [Dehalococcoidales bacterium]|nr:DNA primase [Dehalococcoidales bacterium]